MEERIQLFLRNEGITLVQLEEVFETKTENKFNINRR